MMSNKFCLVVLVLTLATPSYTVIRQDSVEYSTREKIVSGLEAGHNLVQTLRNKRGAGFLSSIGDFVQFLGASAGLVSFALRYDQNEDAYEFKYMLDTWKKVNDELHELSQDFVFVDMVRNEARQNKLLAQERIIHQAHQRLYDFMSNVENMTCSNLHDCRERRIRLHNDTWSDVNSASDTFRTVMHNVGDHSMDQESSLNMVKYTFGCHISKMDAFASGILLLAVKAQQVIQAELVVGQKEEDASIIKNMNEWVTAMYRFRGKVSDVKSECYKTIANYMSDDIRARKYISKSVTDLQAAETIKTDFDEKYAWISWAAIAFKNDARQVYSTIATDDEFFKTIKDDHDRQGQRAFIIFPYTNGTYTIQKRVLILDIENLSRKTDIDLDKVTSHSVYNIFADRLKASQILDKIRGIVIATEGHTLNIVRNFTQNDGVYHKSILLSNSMKSKNVKVEIFVALKSTEEMVNGKCSLKCQNSGVCKTLPYSTKMYCDCPSFTDGHTCERKVRMELALVIKRLFDTSSQLPKLALATETLGSMDEFLAPRMPFVLKAMSDILAQLSQGFIKTSRRSEEDLKWIRFVRLECSSISSLQYFIQRFVRLHRVCDETNAEARVRPIAYKVVTGAEKWLSDYNMAISGREDASLFSKPPVLFLYMNQEGKHGCTETYKHSIDTMWRKLLLFQLQAYIMWTLALDVVGKRADAAMQLYRKQTFSQMNELSKNTCAFDIPNSSTVQCSGGLYVHRDMKIQNNCSANFFLSGRKTVSCENRESSCLACDCNPNGSSSMECNAITGQCACNKSNYYGRSCHDRDCTIGMWSIWSQCSKTCNYGGIKSRERAPAQSVGGKGKPCAEQTSESTACFSACCEIQYHCSKSEKCIPVAMKCNYETDCDSKEDEDWDMCRETCKILFTPWNVLGKHVVYLDRHNLNGCGQNGAMKMFRMELSGAQMRMKYVCCELNVEVGSRATLNTPSNVHAEGHIAYLDRHTVDCGADGILNQLWLRRQDKDHMYYRYMCLRLTKQTHKNNFDCYETHSAYTSEGDGVLERLAEQIVDCRDRYFLNKFVVRRKTSASPPSLRYEFRCCRISEF